MFADLRISNCLYCWFSLISNIMPENRKISHENGQLSIDFIIGFTIFMLAFIFVATMISGLLINLQSKTIDYDAVAYRTGVLLVEDPGEPYDWHLLDLSITQNENLTKRLGLGIARNNPGIIHANKITKFFDPTTTGCSVVDKLCYPSHYAEKLIFGDYPYQFNIALQDIDRIEYVTPLSIGETPPDKYGYIRRVVGIKKPGYALIDNTMVDLTSNNLTIHFPIEDLYFRSLDQAYKIDPITEEFSIHLKEVIPSDTTFLTSVELYKYPGPASMLIPANSPTIRIYDENGPYPYPPTRRLIGNATIVIEEGYFQNRNVNELSELELRLYFDQLVGHSTTFEIADIAHNPPITWAVMEIKIW